MIVEAKNNPRKP